MGHFWLLSVQDEPGVVECISDFPDFQQLCISKMVGRGAKQT